MKKIFSSILFVIFYACAEAPPAENKTVSADSVQTKTCKKSVNFGSTKICLPTISGMNECYAHPLVKAKADAFEFKGNSVLAFYLDDDTYKQVDKINEISFDNFFKVYATDAMKDQEMSQSSLDELSKLLEGSYLKENWSDLKSKIEADHSEIQVGTPVLIETIRPHNNVRTFVMVTRYKVEGKFTDIVMAANAILIEKSLIWLAYYNNYQTEKTIDGLKAKNAKIIDELLKANGI